jgi:hypothetical protein
LHPYEHDSIVCQELHPSGVDTHALTLLQPQTEEPAKHTGPPQPSIHEAVDPPLDHVQLQVLLQIEQLDVLLVNHATLPAAHEPFTQH